MISVDRVRNIRKRFSEIRQEADLLSSPQCVSSERLEHLWFEYLRLQDELENEIKKTENQNGIRILRRKPSR